MNTKQLKYVLAVSREGSFSKAAEVLNITQPSLSQYIKKLEKSVGLPLFDRTKNNVQLTDAGRIYVEIGKQILGLEQQMEKQIADLMVYKSGSLVLGTAPYRAASMMPVIAARFQKVHPGMHLIIREGTTAELVEGMERGEYDLCVTLLPLDKKLFTYQKVLEEEIVLAVPAAWTSFEAVNIEKRKYPAIDVGILNQKSLIQLTDAQYMQKQLELLIADYQLSIRTAAVVKSIEAQIEMVKAGVGMAVVPSGIERFCAPQEVVFYSFVQHLPKREVVVMWRKDRELSQIANELKNIILLSPKY